jgi:DNA-binding HxlR family transcriptional regulator
LKRAANVMPIGLPAKEFQQEFPVAAILLVSGPLFSWKVAFAVDHRIDDIGSGSQSQGDEQINPRVPTDRRLREITCVDSVTCSPFSSDIFVMQQIFAGKWRLPILIELLEGTRRLSDLERAIPEGTKKMLVDSLRSLEALNWITRNEYSKGGRRVEYSLTGTMYQQVARLIEPIHTK